MEDIAAGGGSFIVKTIPVIRDLSLNPCCDHGPTILFDRNGSRFFTCSAYRSRKLCSFYLPEEKWKSHGKEIGGNEEALETKGKRCFEEVESDGKLEGSKKKKLRKEKPESHPLITPNQRDKGEAQYHFNDATVQFFMKQLENLEVDSILCVGTPSLHEYVSNLAGRGEQERPVLNTFLLDIDERFDKLYNDGFTLYNMCNHHFFQSSSKYSKFLAKSHKLAVIVDPPFGVKVELIWHGCLMGVHRDLMRFRKNSAINSESNKDEDLGFEVFWIFPYFNEGHILKCSDSRLQMSDFHVEYKNHTKYSGSETKSKSSPVRVFTTVPLSSLILSKKDYRHCDICDKWVDKQNIHCGPCGTCTTKDGGRTYQHCQKCARCVKPTWKHCSKCDSCHLMDSSCKKIIRQGHCEDLVLNARKAPPFIPRKDYDSSTKKNWHNNRNVKQRKQQWKRNKK